MAEALGTALLETLAMVGASSVIAASLGLPIGLVLLVTANGHLAPHPWTNRVLGFVVNAMRSVPFVSVMVSVIPLTRWLVGSSIGTTAAIVPLALAAAPFVARLCEEALRQVDPAAGRPCGGRGGPGLRRDPRASRDARHPAGGRAGAFDRHDRDGRQPRRLIGHGRRGGRGGGWATSASATATNDSSPP
jgi:hypothetical protein